MAKLCLVEQGDPVVLEHQRLLEKLGWADLDTDPNPAEMALLLNNPRTIRTLTKTQLLGAIIYAEKDVNFEPCRELRKRVGKMFAHARWCELHWHRKNPCQAA